MPTLIGPCTLPVRLIHHVARGKKYIKQTGLYIYRMMALDWNFSYWIKRERERARYVLEPFTAELAAQINKFRYWWNGSSVCIVFVPPVIITRSQFFIKLLHGTAFLLTTIEWVQWISNRLLFFSINNQKDDWFANHAIKEYQSSLYIMTE